VNHGLRGEASEADARFCAELCAGLEIPFRERRIELAREGPSLEARARTLRMDALVHEARESAHTTIVTGHHKDDALETLIQRWTRGSDLAGVAGPRPELVLDGEARIRLVRPLLPLRREEVRRLLHDRGLAWREDASNADDFATRNRIRSRFLPELAELGGDRALDNLRAFGAAVERLEARLASATAHIAWRARPYEAALRGAPLATEPLGPWHGRAGGVVPRGELALLPAALLRRVLWRLLAEGTGAAPTRRLLEKICADLLAARTKRHAAPRGFSLLLASDRLELVPPRRATPMEPPRSRQGWLPFPPRAAGIDESSFEECSRSFALDVPGSVVISDGRRIDAAVSAVPRGAPIERTAHAVELDAAGLPLRLTVRFPRPGDRFHGLGAPGSKRLVRFLADRRVPREERDGVPLVFADGELVWVAGISPCDRRRVGAHTDMRLRLSLRAP
jgi:tRNA(Ile)-lysidine synthase